MLYRFVATKSIVLITMALLSVGAPAAQTTQTQPSAVGSEMLRKQAVTALAAEITVQKASNCPNATSTREIEDCLNKELAKTQKNYSTFASALRGLLQREGNDSAVSEFDKIESESKKYRQLCVEAASNRFKGGSIAPIVALQTQQKLLRFHLQELSVVYANELENH